MVLALYDSDEDDSPSTTDGSSDTLVLTEEDLGLDSGSTDSTSDSRTTDSGGSSSTTDSTDSFQDPEEELIEASLGTSDGVDEATGTNILAGGGATTAAGITTDADSEEIDPEASAVVAQDTERMVEGDDPDIPTPEEAFAEAQAAMEDAAPTVENVTVAGEQVHPYLIAGFLLAAFAGYKIIGG